MAKRSPRSHGRSGAASRQRTPPRAAQRTITIAPERILAALAALPDGGTAVQIARALGLEGDAARATSASVKELVEQGQLLEIRPGRYLPSGSGGEHAAVIEAGEQGGLIARLPDGERLPLDERLALRARVGDVCQVMRSDDGKALMTRILRRSGRTVVGAVNFRPGGMVFVPDNRREGELPVHGTYKGFESEYQAGDRVRGTLVVDDDGEAAVVIDGILGDDTPEVVDFTYVKLVHDLPGDFPEEVEAEAAKFKDRLPVGDREDLSEELVFTIDPATAKDFDDALSLRERPEGGWTISVHIADVSHYVTEHGPIDAEAAARATSIYLINRVIPMLPETLSNGLCSLVPHRNRYALTVHMDVDRHLRLIGTRLSESIIHSKQRLTYEQALDVLNGKDLDLDPALVTVIRTFGEITQGLRKARERAGALNLYSVEHRFRLDVEGNPVEVTQESTDPSHQLIEECMLLANKAVALWLEQQGFPCVYRVHAPPDPERLEQFAAILEAYGIDAAGVQDRFGLQRILRRLEQEPRAARLVLNFMCLRSFKKAVYAVENIGHYALAFDSYAHFTSPIRRYPDLLVHRLVKRALGLKDYAKVEKRGDYLDALARQSSWLEQRAEGAERTLHARKCARFLAQRLGESFPAVITGASGGGLFVQLLETGMEGFLPVRELGDDFYRYDAERFALIGDRSGRVLGPGTEVTVLVSNVDIERSDVIFALDGFAAKPKGGGQSIVADLERLGGRGKGGSSSTTRRQKKPAAKDPRGDKRRLKEEARRERRQERRGKKKR